MDVHIADVVSTVRAVDNEALLSPQVMEQIVRAVLRAVEENEAHRVRLQQEQRIAGGGGDEYERGWS
ncbi:MAG: hypothetical protein KY456_09535 [Chloroflexi bacterium]|nr:hypothetical protein [Chloroflexota bacterium]